MVAQISHSQIVFSVCVNDVKTNCCGRNENGKLTHRASVRAIIHLFYQPQRGYGTAEQKGVRLGFLAFVLRRIGRAPLSSEKQRVTFSAFLRRICFADKAQNLRLTRITAAGA
jgi:hypothetical protein